ncbi:Tetratricopeptide-like helical domain superfamily [Sesbania bispinosa]|nr:Tetratricopeptide-like helical domain superfamily [Sesbania bispinosa]
MSTPTVTLDTALDQTGVRVSPELVENILKRFENAGMSAFRFFEWAEKQRNYTHTIRAYHLMIESLAKIRQYQIMWDLVNAMRKKGMLNVETFCIIMRKYARAHKVDEAVYTFNVMDKYDVPQNLVGFNGLLSALCKSKNVRKAQEIFDSMKGRFVPDSKTYSILLEGWGKAPNLPKAREVFREMVSVGCSPDIVTYGIMVDILCKAGRVDEAVEVVKDMDASNCRPTSFIYSVLVHTYGVETGLKMQLIHSWRWKGRGSRQML